MRLFRYFHWFPRKSTVKLDNWNIFDGRHALEHCKKSIGNFLKASHTLARWCVSNTRAKFRSNPITLDTPIIRLNWGNTRKSKTRVLGTERFRHFSHLIKGPITWGGLARLAGLARFPGISARLWNILKINFAITWKNLRPASWEPGIVMPGSRLAGTTLSRH